MHCCTNNSSAVHITSGGMSTAGVTLAICRAELRGVIVSFPSLDWWISTPCNRITRPAMSKIDNDQGNQRAAPLHRFVADYRHLDGDRSGVVSHAASPTDPDLSLSCHLSRLGLSG